MPTDEVSIEGTVIKLWAPSTPNVQQVGLIADDTAATKFTTDELRRVPDGLTTKTEFQRGGTTALPREIASNLPAYTIIHDLQEAERYARMCASCLWATDKDSWSPLGVRPEPRWRGVGERDRRCSGLQQGLRSRAGQGGRNLIEGNKSKPVIGYIFEERGRARTDGGGRTGELRVLTTREALLQAVRDFAPDRYSEAAGKDLKELRKFVRNEVADGTVPVSRAWRFSA